MTADMQTRAQPQVDTEDWRREFLFQEMMRKLRDIQTKLQTVDSNLKDILNSNREPMEPQPEMLDKPIDGDSEADTGILEKLMMELHNVMHKKPIDFGSESEDIEGFEEKPKGSDAEIKIDIEEKVDSQEATVEAESEIQGKKGNERVKIQMDFEAFVAIVVNPVTVPDSSVEGAIKLNQQPDEDRAQEHELVMMHDPYRFRLLIMDGFPQNSQNQCAAFLDGRTRSVGKIYPLQFRSLIMRIDLLSCNGIYTAIKYFFCF